MKIEILLTGCYKHPAKMIYNAIQAANCTQLAEAGTPCESGNSAAFHAMVAAAALAVPIFTIVPLILRWYFCSRKPVPVSEPEPVPTAPLVPPTPSAPLPVDPPGPLEVATDVV